MDFLESLDKSRYVEFVVEILNDITKGAIKEPAIVNEVYNLASTRLIANRSHRSGYVASYATIGTQQRKRNSKTGGSPKTDTDEDKSTGKKEDEYDADKSDEGSIKVEKIKCFSCGKRGHLARNCPEQSELEFCEEIDQADLDEPIGDNGATIIHTVASMGRHEPVGKNEFILDTGSQVSIPRPDFLCDLYPCNSGFRGVHGEPTLTTEKGRLAGLSACISSTKARLNVLSYAEVENNCDIEVIPKIGFRVHMGNRSLNFIKRNKLYVADLSAWKATNIVLMTTYEREHMYTRREKRKALEAK